MFRKIAVAAGLMAAAIAGTAQAQDDAADGDLCGAVDAVLPRLAAEAYSS